jgi:hypothetical protein
MARRDGTGGRSTPTVPQRMTKAERKEQARKERLELLRRQEQRKVRRRIAIVVGSIVVIGGIAAAVIAGVTGGGGTKKNPASDPRSLPGMLTTQATAAQPWPANSADALTRADAVGLPALGNESFHHHDLLQVFIHGDPIPVPAQIGISSEGGASMHTHDATGIMHLESGTPYSFILGEFFDVWGVLLTNRCIGGYCTSGPNELRVYVNGQQVTTDVRAIALTQHEDVVVTYGTTAQLPNPIPKDYANTISPSCGNSC